MANPHKGDMDVEIDGKTYTLRLDIDAICQLEALGQPLGFATFGAIGAAVDAGNVTLLRATMWAALRRHHAEVGMAEAGELIEALGVAETGPLIAKVILLTFPAQEEGAARPRRRTARAGTGSAS
jgi:hypothetical protein